MSPFISIVVPIYNVELYLNECLDSILSQTFTDFEVIMVNDGTKDKSAEIAATYASKDTRFKLFSKANGGLSSARNFGLLKTKGRYVYFLDSDDFIRKDALEILNGVVQESLPDVVFFSGQIFRHPKVDDVVKILQRNPVLNPISGMLYLERMYSKAQIFPQPPLYISRRELLLESNLQFSEGYIHEDEEFTMKLCLRAKAVVAISDVLFFYRIRNDSITQTNYKLINVSSYLFVAQSLLNESLDPIVSSGAQLVLQKRASALFRDSLRISKQLNTDKALSKQLCANFANDFIKNHRISLSRKLLIFLNLMQRLIRS